MCYWTLYSSAVLHGPTVQLVVVFVFFEYGSIKILQNFTTTISDMFTDKIQRLSRRYHGKFLHIMVPDWHRSGNRCERSPGTCGTKISKIKQAARIEPMTSVLSNHPQPLMNHIFCIEHNKKDFNTATNRPCNV